MEKLEWRRSRPMHVCSLGVPQEPERVPTVWRWWILGSTAAALAVVVYFLA